MRSCWFCNLSTAWSTWTVVIPFLVSICKRLDCISERGHSEALRGERLVINVFSQSIMRTWTHHRGTTDTEKSPKRDRCVWETQRNQVQKVRRCNASVFNCRLISSALVSMNSLTTFLKPIIWLHSVVSAKLPQTPKQRKGHRWLPLREVQEDESTILRSWILCF